MPFCSDCGRTFGSVESKCIHVEVTGHAGWGCTDCSRLFVSPTDLDIHWEAIHSPVRASSPVLSPSRVDWHNCSDCGREYAFEDSLWNHSLETGHASYGCRDCPRNFYSPAAVDRHFSAMHGSPRRTLGGDYECATCYRRFYTQGACLDHLAVTGHL